VRRKSIYPSSGQVDRIWNFKEKFSEEGEKKLTLKLILVLGDRAALQFYSSFLLNEN
jgi:hypothetical protein